MEHFARDCPTAQTAKANLVQKRNRDTYSTVGVEVIAQENVVIPLIFRSIKTIYLACGQSLFEGIVESGAEISVIRKAVVPGY